MNQFGRYLLVGVANTALGYAVIFACMYLLKLSPEISNAAGYMFGLFVSYALNRHFTFKSTQRSAGEFVRFVLVFLTAYVSNLLVLVLLVRVLAMHAAVGQLIAGVVYIAATYLLNRHYVFRGDGLSR